MKSEMIKKSVIEKVEENIYEDSYQLRQPIIDGLLRDGEIMNIVGRPKIGKGCMACDLAVAIATGSLWLDRFQCKQGKVLMLDTELGNPTLQNRLHDIIEARGISVDGLQNTFRLKSFRGMQPDFDGLDSYLGYFKQGDVNVIIINAFYRFLIPGMREDDYNAMGKIYRMLQYHAQRIGCSFVQVQFPKKYHKSGEPVDLASVCLSDTQLLLHPHRFKGAAVLEFAARTFKPIKPVCARLDYPLWKLEPEMNPEDFEGKTIVKKKSPKTQKPRKKSVKKNVKKAAKQRK